MLKYLLAALLCSIIQTSYAATPLKGWVLQNNEYPNHQGLIKFFEQVKQNSQGKYEGSIFWRDTSGVQKDIVPKFAAGEYDFVVFSSGALSTVVPDLEVLTLPFLFRNQEHMLKVLDSEVGTEMAADLAKKNYIVLAWYNGGSRSFISRSKPLRNATDFANLKVRVANRDTMIAMVKMLGGEYSSIPYEKVDEALKSGELDATENDIISYETSEQYKYAPNYSISHHNVLPEALLVSVQLWNKLSPAERDMMRKAAEASSIYMRQQRTQLEAKVRARLEKNGVKFTNIASSEGFIARMKKVYAPAIKTPRATDLMLRIMSTH